MKQQLIVLLAAGLMIFVVIVLTSYVEQAEDIQNMQEMLSQENVLTEEQMRNIDQNIVDEFYNQEGSEETNTLGYNFTFIVNDVVQ